MPAIDDAADSFRGGGPDLGDDVVDVIGRRLRIGRHSDREVFMEQRHALDGIGTDVAQHRPDDRVP